MENETNVPGIGNGPKTHAPPPGAGSGGAVAAGVVMMGDTGTTEARKPPMAPMGEGGDQSECTFT